MVRVDIHPDMLRWARERAGLSLADLARRFPKFSAWESGDSSPTFKQLEVFAKAAHVPFGYLFLPEPPQESIPIPDLRTIRRDPVRQPNPNLLDTLHAMQRRQAWLREELIDCQADSPDLAWMRGKRIACLG